MSNDHKYNRVESLLKDDVFLSSVLGPNRESDIFWNEKIVRGDISREDYEMASDIILSLVKNENRRGVSDEKLAALWQRIELSAQSITPAARKRSETTRSIYIALVGVACVIFGLMILWPRGEDFGTINGAKICYSITPDTSGNIQLVLGDDMMDISGDEAHINHSSGELTVNDRKITREDQEQKRKEVRLMQLTVPFGKRSSITLPDNSRLWVNAGTSVIYPEEFANNRREIYVNGEVYGEITSDPKCPFVIKTKKLNVEVLGTTLNVTAYENENDISVVLVSGKVAVKPYSGKRTELNPTQGYFASGDKPYVTNVDVSQYISWKDGKYKFRNERIGVIVHRLSKYYNIKVVSDPYAADMTCSGELILKDDIETVLDVICTTASIKHSWDEQSGTFILHR